MTNNEIVKEYLLSVAKKSRGKAFNHYSQDICDGRSAYEGDDVKAWESLMELIAEEVGQ